MTMIKAYINLLPAEAVREPIGVARQRGIMGVAVVLVLLAVVSGLQWRKTLAAQDSVAHLQKQKAELEVKVASLQKELGLSDVRVQELKKDEERLRAIRALFSDRILWSAALQEISHLVPEGLWLTLLESKDLEGRKELRLSGNALAYPSLSRFLTALERSPRFAQAQLLSSVKKREEVPQKDTAKAQDQPAGREVIQFDISCRLKTKG
jgi:Tfp pilus assembly protein PilN